MVWIYIALCAIGLAAVGQGVLLIAWSLWEMLMLLFRRDEWRDYPDLDESLRRFGRRRR
jgi:hypothetical protein